MADEPTPNSSGLPPLVDALSSVINRYSRENVSNTPDFILAEYLLKCLEAFEATSLSREKWYGKSLSIGGGSLREP